MSTKSHKDSNKYAGRHGSVIPFVHQFIDEIHKLDDITKITLGYIRAGLSPSSGGGRVKIGYGGNKHILLTCRGGTSRQEIHITTTNSQKTKLAIARLIRNREIRIAFEKKPT